LFTAFTDFTTIAYAYYRIVPAGVALDEEGVLIDSSWRDAQSDELRNTAAAGNAVRDRIVETLTMNAITRVRNHNLH
jgi:hypothetical protein